MYRIFASNLTPPSWPMHHRRIHPAGTTSPTGRIHTIGCQCSRSTANKTCACVSHILVALMHNLLALRRQPCRRRAGNGCLGNNSEIIQISPSSPISAISSEILSTIRRPESGSPPHRSSFGGNSIQPVASGLRNRLDHAWTGSWLQNLHQGGRPVPSRRLRLQ